MINNKEVKYSSKSIADDFGRVFFYDNRVFREISEKSSNDAEELLNSSLYSELLAKNLIPETKIVNDFAEETNSVIYEHKKLKETFRHEWTFQMFKHAALAILEINEICRKHGYELKDAHTMNVLFEGIQPQMVDLGSFAKTTTKKPWIAYNEFLQSFIVPLTFWSMNEYFIVRQILESHYYRMVTIPNQTFEESKLITLLQKDDFSFKINGKKLYSTKTSSKIINYLVYNTNRITRKLKLKLNFSYAQKTSLLDIFPEKEVENYIKNLTAPNKNSLWQGYHEKAFNNVHEIQFSARQKRLSEIIASRNNITTAIDLAGNEGYFSILLSENPNIEKITLVDYDENALNAAYLNLKKLKNQKISILLSNFIFIPNLKDTTDRLKSDVAIALALTHHLILTQNFTIEIILERLALFSKKYVMIEFMPLGLWSSMHENVYPTIPDWYTLEWFRAEFCKKFNPIVEEQVEKNRIVFFGELK